eukprot:TRINITY_DN8498_c0_g1_i1.p1 TRINITY_DN8498_c0_g1~~TRINITY_DN8498_c0_g1_i1.p1  ORF type:complete len:125 (+),score=23.74 TRINITY_DN8498_c0_g1_i1:57-377(+)
MMKVSNQFVKGHNNNRHLSPEEMENNIGGLPVTDNRLRELFNSFDADNTGFLEKDEVKQVYKEFDNYGVEYTDREIDSQIQKYAIRDDGKVDYDEFCCIILSIAQR